MGCSFRPDWVAGFLRIRWQLCTGLGGRNYRNTQLAQQLRHSQEWAILHPDQRINRDTKRHRQFAEVRAGGVGLPTLFQFRNQRLTDARPLG